jgi:hypothetical protein
MNRKKTARNPRKMMKRDMDRTSNSTMKFRKRTVDTTIWGARQNKTKSPICQECEEKREKEGKSDGQKLTDLWKYHSIIQL